MVKADLEKAIEYIEECRESHVLWADWLRRYPEEAVQPAPVIETAGDIPFHEEWVRKYDHVLAVLRGVAHGGDQRGIYTDSAMLEA